MTETDALLTNGSYVTGDTKAYTYDNAGNLSTVKANNVLKTQYAYDSLNRMSGATLYTLSKMPSIVNPDASLTYQVQSQSTSFTYNAEAQRIGKVVSVTSTVDGRQSTDTASLRHYNNGTAIVADGITRGNATELNSYIFGEESEPGYAQFEALYDGTTLYFAEVDTHTDVTELIGVNGQTASYSYDAYGNAINAISGGVYNPYRYTSQYLDEETGLYYLRARYYDPSNGRFTQEDSYLGEENNSLTLNLYMYCHGNPLMFRDLSGHDGIAISFGTLAFLLGVTFVAVWGIVIALDPQMKQSFNSFMNGLVYTLRQMATWIVQNVNAIIDYGVKTMVKAAQQARTKARRRINTYANHHIVPKQAGQATEVQGYCTRVGIKYKTDSRNLVRIKTKFHEHLHTKLYYDSINGIIRGAYKSGKSIAQQRDNIFKAITFVKCALLAIGKRIPW